MPADAKGQSSSPAGKTAVDDVQRVARQRLGLPVLRPGQAEAVQAVISGKDTLAVLPTGSGKTAIYELAAALLGGPTIVVSPLLALQRDQLRAIGEHELGGAAAVNSEEAAEEAEAALEETRRGCNEFLFVAPEQLASQEVRQQLQGLRASLFVVDEAHCVSEWGHDFRPDYLRLGEMIEALRHPTVLALTATASPAVREDIVRCLGMRDPTIVVTGFDRPQIRLAVVKPSDPKQKLPALLEAVAAAQSPGIVYAASRRATEEIASALSKRGIAAAAYHAGLAARRRREREAAFMEGRTSVMVATIAFGMGIDKPDVRFVYHHDASDSLDAYHQEIGRAARDGEPADARLFYRPEDLRLSRWKAAPPHLDQKTAASALELLKQSGGTLRRPELANALHLSRSRVTRLLNLMAEIGAVSLSGDDVASTGMGLEPALDAARRHRERLRQHQLSKTEMMRGYAEATGCRRAYLLSYLGEHLDGPCGNCDNCDAGAGLGEASDQRFSGGSTVRHPKWGQGEVVRYDEEAVVVLFETVGYRRLDLATVRERGLLEGPSSGGRPKEPESS